MQLKLISAVALSVISMHVMAFEGNGFKIISDKVTHSPGFNGGFQEVALKKSVVPAYVNTMAFAYDAEGHVMDYIKIKGDHNISISNYTSQTQRYAYTYVLSCESAYEQFERTVEIYPHGNFSDSSHSYGTVQKESESTFGINVSTKISGAENSWHEAHAALRVRK